MCSDTTEACWWFRQTFVGSVPHLFFSMVLFGCVFVFLSGVWGCLSYDAPVDFQLRGTHAVESRASGSHLVGMLPQYSSNPSVGIEAYAGEGSRFRLRW